MDLAPLIRSLEDQNKQTLSPRPDKTELSYRRIISLQDPPEAALFFPGIRAVVEVGHEHQQAGNKKDDEDKN